MAFKMYFTLRFTSTWLHCFNVNSVISKAAFSYNKHPATHSNAAAANIKGYAEKLLLFDTRDVKRDV